jgi:signal peptidase I
MAKKKNTPQYRRTEPATPVVDEPQPATSRSLSKKTQQRSKLPAADEPRPASSRSVAIRETIESIVVAFVLAFLFRTFEAEAFVIPTGSMSPSLQGQHKDVRCSECGYRFRTSASTEGEERDAMLAELRSNPSMARRQQLQDRIMGLEVIAGMCPMCRQTMLFRDDGLPTNLPPWVSTKAVEFEPTYPGDRILVNKYGYDFHKPERWDVVVFKFPGDGEMNYIKRLVGLPNEELKLFQGDVFTRPLGDGRDFVIERKPPEKVYAMLQPVHDTDYDPAILYKAGWPLRWSDSATDGWETVADADGQNVAQQFKITAQEKPPADAPVAWLRYQHLIPSDDDWANARYFAETGKHLVPQAEWLEKITPELITDFNPYNAEVQRQQILAHHDLSIPQYQLGMNWVSDLAVVCNVDVHEARGELLLDLVKGGKHFTCRIDLSTGKASLEIEGQPEFAPTAETDVNAVGEYRLQFANVDDQLLLWVDGHLVRFEGETGAAEYDADAVFGGRKNAIPRTSAENPGDWSPAGIGARGAAVTIDHLEVLRDIYYIAVDWHDGAERNPYQTEFTQFNEVATLEDGTRLESLAHPRQIFRDPEAWPRFLTRRDRRFEVKDKQFFVMGDNSPASLDCRLWRQGSRGAIPGGAYLDARLMTGEAVYVFWPHSWGGIPGLKMLPGFPNFKDMRIVR